MLSRTRRGDSWVTGPERVWARVAARGRHRQPGHVVVPAFAMKVLRLDGESVVAKPNDGMVAVRDEGYLDCGGARRHRGAVAFPTPGEHNLGVRHNLDVLAAGDVLAADLDAINPARSRVQRRVETLLLHHLLAIGEVAEHGLGTGRHADLPFDRLILAH